MVLPLLSSGLPRPVWNVVNLRIATLTRGSTRFDEKSLALDQPLNDLYCAAMTIFLVIDPQAHLAVLIRNRHNFRLARVQVKVPAGSGG